MRSVFLFVRRVEEIGLAIAMLAMAAVTIANVVVRNLTGETLAFAEELNQFLIVFVCFVGLSYAAGMGRHIRMTAISDALPHGLRRGLRIVVCATTALLLVALGWYAARYAWSVDRRSPVLDVPMRVVYCLAPLGLWMGALQYVLATLRNLRSPTIWASFDRPDGHEEIDLGDAGDAESALDQREGGV